jgi:acetyl esterase/lipase
MAYKIDADGTVDLGGVRVPVPATVSREARVYLASPPWVDAPPSDQVRAMWESRAVVDASLAELNRYARKLFPVSIEEIQIRGVGCHLVKPAESVPRDKGRQPILINMHGGGFVMGSGSLVEAIPIANLSRIPVISIDYRLAPEHPYPAAIEDILAVYREVLRHHAPEDIGIYGSSAGGFLTGQTVMHLNRDGLPLPACLGIFTAGGDLSDLGDSARLFTLSGFWGEPILPSDHELSEIRAYVGTAGIADPLLSPARGDLSGFPPTLLVTGTRDALLSGAAAFHRALLRAGADAELVVFEAMPHSHWYNLRLPEAREALDIMVGHFRKHLSGERG